MPVTETINQCDGCRRGLPLRGGIHRGEGYDLIACTADRYDDITFGDRGIAINESSDRICAECGGTILPPSAAGNDRGTCHCPKPGRIWARMYYSTDTHPAWRTYGVEWDGAFITVEPPTLTHATRVLNKLRTEWRAKNGELNQ